VLFLNIFEYLKKKPHDRIVLLILCYRKLRFQVLFTSVKSKRKGFRKLNYSFLVEKNL